MIAEDEEIDAKEQGENDTQDNEYDLDGLFHCMIMLLWDIYNYSVLFRSESISIASTSIEPGSLITLLESVSEYSIIGLS